MHEMPPIQEIPKPRDKKFDSLLTGYGFRYMGSNTQKDTPPGDLYEKDGITLLVEIDSTPSVNAEGVRYPKETAEGVRYLKMKGENSAFRPIVEGWGAVSTHELKDGWLAKIYKEQE